MRKTAKTANICIILLGIFALFLDYMLLSAAQAEEIGIGVAGAAATAATPRMTIFLASSAIGVIGVFLIILAVLCMRKGISCVKF